MNLANPTALFWLGLVVPIVIFYILKIRLRRVPTNITDRNGTPVALKPATTEILNLVGAREVNPCVSMTCFSGSKASS